jgi:hypothetical protein
MESIFKEDSESFEKLINISQHSNEEDLLNKTTQELNENISKQVEKAKAEKEETAAFQHEKGEKMKGEPENKVFFAGVPIDFNESIFLI